MPFFSVLIPTRNRARLLAYAVESVLDQDFTDFEVVINDNASSDATRETVAGFSDPRIKYAGSSRFLLTHENWNACYDRALGEYLLVLGDDDMLLPGALAQTAAVIKERQAQLLSFGVVTYYDSTYFEERLKNTILARDFSGKVIRHDAEKVISDYLSFRSGLGYPPHPSAMVFRKKTAEGLKAKCGAFYLTPLGEIIAVPWLIRRTGAMYVIDKPLAVIGRGNTSQVAQEIHDPASMWKNADTDFRHTPCKGKYTYNALAESLLRLQKLEPENFGKYTLPMGEYFLLYYQDLMEVARAGGDVNRDLAEFYEKLGELPLQTGRSVRRRLLLLKLKLGLRSLLLKLGLFDALRRYIGHAGAKRIKGSDLGITDIAGCAAKISAIGAKAGQPLEIWDSRVFPTNG
ncbi:MAG: glycosyltransferase family A protein [Elusimicrobiales bacterium]|jgi:glycosyltransferase involved in cell wall biosynthesis